MSILIFSLYLGWFPSSQMGSFPAPDSFLLILLDRLKHIILPAFVLSIPLITFTSKFVRGSFSDVLNQNYIRTALAFGLNKNKIIFHYALKNALLPLATLIGLYLPFLLGGAVITEYIFAWPGMGRITVDAIFAHDYPVIIASNFVAAIAVVIGNLISDIMYTLIDPRIRFSNYL